jgi:hypothetical protein
VATHYLIDYPYQLDERRRYGIMGHLLVFNPGGRDASCRVTISTFSADARAKTVTVPARRLARVYMDDVAKRNEHYGARISADRPMAAQWVREIRWFDGDELMSVWSLPCAASPA